MYKELSEIDRVIMEVIWDKQDVSVAELVEIFKSREWSRHFIKTYIARLIKKEYIEVNAVGPKKHRYYSIVNKDDFLAEKSSDFLAENFEGLSFMIAGLMKKERISPTEIEEIEALIMRYKTSKEDK